MKQVRRFVDDYDVTTCGPGPQPHPKVRHIELDVHFAPQRGRLMQFVDEFARERERFRWTYRNLPMVVQIRTLLAHERFDVAIANDADTVGIASEIVGSDRVHADLHEFFPGLPQPDSELGRRQTRYWEWLVRAHCAPAASATTVGQAIAGLYADYGVMHCEVVTNASPPKQLPVRPTGTPIRLVHSGNPFKDRGLETIMRAVARAETDVTLDLYLMKQNVAELNAVIRLAHELGPRITVHDPVDQNQLIETLNTYDVGIHVLPPTSQNNALALPNKFFDFVQARLGVIVGPSVEMARTVHEDRLGWVTDAFDEEAIVQVLDALTPEAVDERKKASDASAYELSAATQVEVWASALERIVSKRGRAK